MGEEGKSVHDWTYLARAVNITDLKFPYKFGNKDLIPTIIWYSEKGPLSLFYMDENAVKKAWKLVMFGVLSDNIKSL